MYCTAHALRHCADLHHPCAWSSVEEDGCLTRGVASMTAQTARLLLSTLQIATRTRNLSAATERELPKNIKTITKHIGLVQIFPPGVSHSNAACQRDR